jgi:hypothetical protein
MLVYKIKGKNIKKKGRKEGAVEFFCLKKKILVEMFLFHVSYCSVKRLDS